MERSLRKATLNEVRYKRFYMPVKKVKGGWKFGNSGKVYKTKEEAEKQAKAIYASGYKSKPKKKNNVSSIIVQKEHG